MCNLSEGIAERAKKLGKEEMILNMYRKKYSVEQIADVAEKSIEEIEAIIEKNLVTA